MDYCTFIKSHRRIMRADHIDIKLFNNNKLRESFIDVVIFWLSTDNEDESHIAYNLISRLRDDMDLKLRRGNKSDVELIYAIKRYIKRRTGYDI